MKQLLNEVLSSDRISEQAKAVFANGFASGGRSLERINFGKPLCRLTITLGDPRRVSYCQRTMGHEGKCSITRD